MTEKKIVDPDVIDMDAERLKRRQASLKSMGIDKSSMKSGSSITPKEFILMGEPSVDGVLVASEGTGIPKGTMVELCGLSGSGKTYLAMKHMAEHHKLGNRTAYLDVENTFYGPRALDLGVQIKNGNLFEYYENIASAEQYGELALELAESGEYGAIVIDSIKAMVPDEEVQKNLSDNAKFGSHASFVKRMLNKLMPACSKSGTIAILINQLWTGSGAMPNTYTLQAAGGKAMEYNTHVRLWVNKINGKAGDVISVQDGQPVRVGRKSRVEVHKSRYGANGLISEFAIMFGKNEGDPIAEFIYRAMAQGKEYIISYGRGANKILRFIDKETGDILAESALNHDLMSQLFTCDPPSKLTRGDKSTTGFEYICGRLKIEEAARQIIMDKVFAIQNGEAAPSVLSDEPNPYEGLDSSSSEPD